MLGRRGAVGGGSPTVTFCFDPGEATSPCTSGWGQPCAFALRLGLDFAPGCRQPCHRAQAVPGGLEDANASLAASLPNFPQPTPGTPCTGPKHKPRRNPIRPRTDCSSMTFLTSRTNSANRSLRGRARPCWRPWWCCMRRASAIGFKPPPLSALSGCASVVSVVQRGRPGGMPTVGSYWRCSLPWPMVAGFSVGPACLMNQLRPISAWSAQCVAVAAQLADRTRSYHMALLDRPKGVWRQVRNGPRPTSQPLVAETWLAFGKPFTAELDRGQMRANSFL